MQKMEGMSKIKDKKHNLMSKMNNGIYYWKNKIIYKVNKSYHRKGIAI